MQTVGTLMSKFKKEFELLTGLGLTSRQSKIYLAIALLEMATAKTISKLSGVRRENIYRTIPQLQEVGLIEKIIDTPIKFKAIEIEDAVSILLNRKIRQMEKMQKEAEAVIENFKKGAYTRGLKIEEKTEFILIPKKIALTHRKIQSINNAEKSIDVITTLKRLSQAGPNYFIAADEALKRGVKIRVITEKPTKELELPISRKSTQKSKNNATKFRYSKQPIKNVIAIIDTKEVYIVTIPHSRLEESPALWSNNPSLIDIIQNYFEKLWNDSLELKHQE